MKKLIMLIDDDPTNLLTGKNALKDLYDIMTVDSGIRALTLLEAFVKNAKKLPDLILLDIEMPELDGYETLKRIKFHHALQGIPVMFLTALSAADNEFEGLSLGAADYITKPFNEGILQKRIETHLSLSEHTHNLEALVENKTAKVLQLQDAILSTVAEMVEFRDDNTGGHIDRTKFYLRLLVEKSAERGLYKDALKLWDVKSLIQAAELHDVGKISIPDNVLNKPGRLDDGEFAIMKTHTEMGKKAIMQIIAKVDESEFLHQAALMAYTHHEKWDGTGYPQGLKGEEIPIHGRLMAIADVYDALISERPYKKGFPHEKAVEIIVEGRGTQFDPLLTDLFEEIHEEFNEIAKNYKSRAVTAHG
ncbi:MAG: response regulator [Oscillospiraceae bacterium]|nr:response regulator [Oscillospiraceae bacterium]